MGVQTPLVPAVVLLLIGCNGSAQLLLKAPIEERCQSAGLRGCPELTDGVLLYVEGDHPKAVKKIHVGASKNEPALLYAFAAKLRELKNVPGADEYVGPLIEVAELLAPDDKTHAAHEDTRDVAAKTSEGDAPRAADRSTREVPAFTASSVVPAADNAASVCQLYADASWESDAIVARCLKIGVGPLVLTDVQTTGACHDVLAIGAGDSVKPRWVLVGEPSTQLAVHGARFPVTAGESLFVAQGGMRTGTLDHGAACLLTWAIER